MLVITMDRWGLIVSERLSIVIIEYRKKVFFKLIKVLMVQNKATLSGGLANQGKVIYMVSLSIQSRISLNINYYPVVRQSTNLYPDSWHLKRFDFYSLQPNILSDLLNYEYLQNRTPCKDY